MIFLKRLAMAALAAVAGFFVGAIHAEVAVVLNSGEGTISVIDKARMIDAYRH